MLRNKDFEIEKFLVVNRYVWKLLQAAASERHRISKLCYIFLIWQYPNIKFIKYRKKQLIWVFGIFASMYLACFENCRGCHAFSSDGITEAVVQMCSVKKVFFKILRNLQETTCARDSSLIKLQASGLQLY